MKGFGVQEFRDGKEVGAREVGIQKCVAKGQYEAGNFY